MKSDEQLRGDQVRPCPISWVASSTAAPEVVWEVSPPFNPIAMSRRGQCAVVRSPKELRLHPALHELGWIGVIDEFNAAARLKEQPVPEPILVTATGKILTGIGRDEKAIN